MAGALRLPALRLTALALSSVLWRVRCAYPPYGELHWRYLLFRDGCALLTRPTVNCIGVVFCSVAGALRLPALKKHYA